MVVRGHTVYKSQKGRIASWLFACVSDQCVLSGGQGVVSAIQAVVVCSVGVGCDSSESGWEKETWRRATETKSSVCRDTQRARKMSPGLNKAQSKCAHAEEWAAECHGLCKCHIGSFSLSVCLNGQSPSLPQSCCFKNKRRMLDGSRMGMETKVYGCYVYTFVIMWKHGHCYNKYIHIYFHDSKATMVKLINKYHVSDTVLLQDSSRTVWMNFNFQWIMSSYL